MSSKSVLSPLASSSLLLLSFSRGGGDGGGLTLLNTILLRLAILLNLLLDSLRTVVVVGFILAAFGRCAFYRLLVQT